MVQSAAKELNNNARAGFELNIWAGNHVFHYKNRIQMMAMIIMINY